MFGFQKLLGFTIWFLLSLTASLIPSEVQAKSCDNLANRAGEHDCDISVRGNNREYSLLVPARYNPNQKTAILVDMHGYNGTRFNQPPFSGWKAKAREEGFIYVSPQGINNSWNADLCCGGNTEDDVSFLKAIIEQVDASFNIDRSKVFASGHSNGGGMSHKLACDAADVFTGIASIAFPITRPANACNPEKPPQIIHFHGLSDTVISYNGGSSGTVSAPESLVAWSNVLNCQSGPKVTYSKNSAYCQTYSECDGGRSSTLCTINGTHFLYNNRDRLNIPDVAWEYLNQESGDGGGEPRPIALSAIAGSFWFWSWVDLTWDNVDGSTVALYKNGDLLSNTANDGSYRDFSGGARQYRLCEIDLDGRVNLARCSETVIP